jgi:hypothetical protein
VRCNCVQGGATFHLSTVDQTYKDWKRACKLAAAGADMGCAHSKGPVPARVVCVCAITDKIGHECTTTLIYKHEHALFNPPHL